LCRLIAFQLSIYRFVAFTLQGFRLLQASYRPFALCFLIELAVEEGFGRKARARVALAGGRGGLIDFAPSSEARSLPAPKAAERRGFPRRPFGFFLSDAGEQVV